MIEWAFHSSNRHDNPFADVTLDLIVTDPEGRELKVPAFWAGGKEWRARYASAVPGRHQFLTECSDSSDAGLHQMRGEVTIEPTQSSGDDPGANRLLAHGPLRVADDHRHLEHRDGTPFFWLADTWWMALSRRLGWPDDFRELTAVRRGQGFTVIHLVAGLFPDMDPFDERGAGDGGYPWDRKFSRINPGYFDAADLRIAHLVRAGLVPCIVGFWGFYLDVAGMEALRAHWRYLIARWGAYPVVWCVCGEALMPFYQSDTFAQLKETVRRGDRWLPAERRASWSELSRFIKATDPHRHPLTIHPTQFGVEQVDDPTVLDLHWLQTGHNGFPSTVQAMDMLEEALSIDPPMPVLDSEGNYEGIRATNGADIQRFQFWSTVLAGAAGYSYGANGIWQVDRQDLPYGASPHGTSWGGLPWDDAYRLPGASHLAVGKRLLERFEWWRFQTHPEWVDPHQDRTDRHRPYAAGIPGEVRVIYVPCECIDPVTVCELETKTRYRAELVDPSSGQIHNVGDVFGDGDGRRTVPTYPVFRDWLVVLQKR